MPSLLTSETAPHRAEHAATEDRPVEGASAIVEAATAEAAIAEVHATYGPSARIVDARRVVRGGIGGFFGKEHVQLHVAARPPGPQQVHRRGASHPTLATDRDDVAARAVALAAELTAGLGDAATSPSGTTPGTTPGTMPGTRPGTTPGATPGATLGMRPGTRPGPTPGATPTAASTDPGRSSSPVDRLLVQDVVSDPVPVETRDQLDFGTYLRQQLAVERAAALPAPTEPGSTEVDDEPSAPPVPAELVAAVREPAIPDVAPPPSVDEVAWASLHAVGEPVVDEGPAWSTTRLLHLGLPATMVHGLAVSAPADDLAWLKAVTDAVRPLCRPLPAGDAVLVGPGAPALAEELETPAARSRTWLAALGSGRWRHLVLGGEQWRDELVTEPLVVSWTRPRELPDALRCAIELGLVLGYGPQGGAVHRARPLDVALAVRALVDAR